MNAIDRLVTIRDFVTEQAYLKGLEFRVRILNGQVLIEFHGISKEQSLKLRKELDDREQHHMTVVNLDKKRRRKRGRRPSNQ